MTEMDDLYLVQNGVNDVVDQDHNTLVGAANYLHDTLGSYINFGNGVEGNLKVGLITDPTATDVASVSLNGSGYVTGTFYYKYSMYNLSGETAVVNASSTVTAAANKVKVTIPAQASNTNVTGYYIYRSIDNVTYYRVGFIAVNDVTSGATEFIDNNPITSGTAPAGATTGTSATISGRYYCNTLTLLSGQTLNITNKAEIIATDIIDLRAGSTINGDGGKSLTSFGQYTLTAGIGSNSHDYPDGGGATIGKKIADSNDILKKNVNWYNHQGNASGNGQTNYAAAGASLLCYARNRLNLNGTISINGQVGSGAAIASGGGAGGIFYGVSKIVDKTSLTANLNGANAFSTGGGASTAFGGGGGIWFLAYEYLIGTGTINVNAGSNVANANTSTNIFGGGCGGDANQVGKIIESNIREVTPQQV